MITGKVRTEPGGVSGHQYRGCWGAPTGPHVTPAQASRPSQAGGCEKKMKQRLTEQNTNKAIWGRNTISAKGFHGREFTEVP